MAKVSFEEIKFVCDYCSLKNGKFTTEEIYNEIKNDVNITFYQLKNICTVIKAFFRKDYEKIDFYKKHHNNGYSYITKNVEKVFKEKTNQEKQEKDFVNNDEKFINVLVDILTQLKELNKKLGDK